MRGGGLLGRGGAAGRLGLGLLRLLLLRLGQMSLVGGRGLSLARPGLGFGLLPSRRPARRFGLRLLLLSLRSLRRGLGLGLSRLSLSLSRLGLTGGFGAARGVRLTQLLRLGQVRLTRGFGLAGLRLGRLLGGAPARGRRLG